MITYFQDYKCRITVQADNEGEATQIINNICFVPVWEDTVPQKVRIETTTDIDFFESISKLTKKEG